MIVKLVGGASVIASSASFNIGKRNILTIKNLLGQHGMGPTAEDVGGHISRTVTVDVDTGRVVIASCGRDHWEI
jgi:chemotaxis protein CheD